jgi:hypothetical protein
MAFFHRRKMELLGFPGRVPASFLSLLFRALLLDAIHLAFGLGDCLNSSEWLEDSC